MVSGWNGRKVRPLVDHIVRRDGGVCWLCGDAGADSADHEPPRSHLVRAGVPNPDHPIYLKAAHILCNKRRGTRPVTPALHAELIAKRVIDLQHAHAAADLSPRFASRRPSFERRSRTGRTGSALPSLESQEKNHKTEKP